MRCLCLKHKYQKYKKRKMKQKNTFMHRDDLSNDNKNYTHELRDAIKIILLKTVVN